MNRVLYYQNLIDMIREIDVEKNDSKTLRDVLDYISSELEKFISDIK